MYWEKTGRLTFGRFPSVEVMAPGLDLKFASRLGGYSKPPFDSLDLGSGTGDDEGLVRRNRALLLSTQGIPADRVARCDQVHGDRIERVTSGGVFPACDGLVTATWGLSLAISTADCYPVIVYSPPERALAALHVGREGARRGIIAAALDILRRDHDVEPSTLVAGTGPGICADCYEVGEDVADLFPSRFVSSSPAGLRLDLRSCCEEQLAAAGVSPGRIFRANVCTSCDSEHCYSYRRDGGETGRHWTLATIFDM